ncbi:DUF6948 domain-containing protein [Agarilytica rhodophyticola]|uniref:DUF6948 domain-containing protein n=1 Tax=Agarilytica rhodophyticola TaxID=1737490 RepID=UPI000B341C38|nr:hypothetical protein [Agarilytica rhodophyticola]
MENLKAVILTTEYRGVFYAEVEQDKDLSAETLTNLKNCRMAINWGATRGVFQLAETGPTENSKISAKADIPVLHKITAVMDVTDEARKAWISH